MVRNHRVSSNYFLGNPLSADDLSCALTDSSSQALTRIKRKQEFRKGEYVFRKGARPENAYIFLNGNARLVLDTDFGQISRTLEPNELFGIMEAVANLPYQMTVKATAKCAFDSIAREDVVNFLRRDSNICFRLIELLAKDFQKGQRLFSSSI